MVEVQKENVLTEFPVILSKKCCKNRQQNLQSSKAKTSENSQKEKKQYGGLRIQQ